MANKSPNIKGITEHSKKRKSEAHNRVCKAIEYKLKNRELISIKSIADKAGVSRNYIYGNTELKNNIESLKENSAVRYNSSLTDAKIKLRTKSLQNQLQAVSEKYKNLQIANTVLQEENSSLKNYIEELTEKLNYCQQRLKITPIIDYNVNKD